MRQNYDKARKAAARARAAATGESYTTALRKVTGAPAGVPEREPAIEVWVAAGSILSDFDIEGGLDVLDLQAQLEEREDDFGRDDEEARALHDDLWAVEFLMQADEETYQAALLAAVEQVAAERGVVVDARPLFSGLEDNDEGSLAAQLLAAAVEWAVLPQLGKAPRDVPEGMSIRQAVNVADRTYLQRIRTDERPDVAAELAQMEAQLEAADLPPGTPVVPLDSLAAGDVVTLQPLKEGGSAAMDPIIDLVQRADEHSVVIGFFGKMVRYNGRLMLDSTGDLFDVVDVARDALARVIAAAAARQGDQ